MAVENPPTRRPPARVVRAAALLALAAAGALGLVTAQASATPANVYWAADSSVGSVQVDDATGVLVAGTRNDTSSTGCVGNFAWTANGSAVYGANGRYVCRGSLDGVSPAADPNWIDTECTDSVGSVYATDTYVYYMCLGGGRLGRVNVDGTNNITNFGNSGGASMDYAYRLAVDANWIYVTGSNQIRRYPIDGGAMDSSWAITETGDVRGVAVDSQYVYWSRYPSRYIGRANLDGTSVNSQWINVGDQFTEGVWGMTVTGSSIYWMTRTPGTLGRANLDGTGIVSPLLDTITANGQNHAVVVVGGTATTPLAAGLTNSAPPSISGTVGVGETLNASAGTWSTTPGQVFYQWQVSSDGGATWTSAPGTGVQTATYTPTRADIGKTLRVRVRAGATGGVLTAASSAATQAVPGPSAPVNTGAPSFAAHGLAAVASRGTWTNSTPEDLTYAYQWRTSPSGAAGTWSAAAGPGNDTASYLVQSADAGRQLQVCVTASNGTDTTTCSAAATAPTPIAPLGRVYLKTYSVLGDGSASQDHVNPGGVWGFSSNGTTNVYGGWTDTLTIPVGSSQSTSLASYPFGSQTGVLIDDQYVYAKIGDAIRRTRIDGTDPQPTFITGAGGGYVMARDAHYLYWGDGSDVRRAPIAGGPVDADWRASFARGVSGLAVDGDFIYASMDGTGTIARADISGSGIENTWVQTGYSDLKGLGIDRNGIYVEARSGSCVGLVYISPDGVGSACAVRRDDDTYAISVVPAAADAGALPANSGGADVPTISGTPDTGNTLSAAHGTWTNSPERYTYRWLVRDYGASTWTAATGASGTTANYEIPAGYGGKDLKVRVIAHNGSTWSEPAYSAAVTVPAPPFNAGGSDLPGISGTAEVGQALTASPGTWSFLPDGYSGYAYQWQVSDDGASGWTAATGDGATTGSYVVAATDDTKYLRVKVTAANDDGTTDAFSVATAQVQVPEPDNTEAPVISGTAEVGQVLTATRGTWTNAAGAEFEYEWQVSDDSLTWSPATGNGVGTDSYTVAGSDLGRYLRVVVTGSNRLFSVDQESAATARVTAPAVPTPAPGPAPEAPPQAAPAPVVVAPGISVGATFNTANLDPSTPAAAKDLLKGAQVNLPASATITFVAKTLPDGVRLVGGRLVASKPGVYVVQLKVKRKNGKVGTRRVRVKVG